MNIPTKNDCYTDWRKYYLSLEPIQFAASINENCHCGHEVEIDFIYKDGTFDGLVSIDDEGGTNIFVKKTSKYILDLIEDIDE